MDIRNLRWKNQWTAPSAIGIVCFGAGIVVGYDLAIRHVNKTIDEVTEVKEELEEEKEQLEMDWPTSRIIEEVTESNIIEAVPESTIFEEVEIITIEEDTDIEMVDYRRITSIDPPIPTPDWDYEVEIPKRSPGSPYIIHKDEFMNQETGSFNQVTLTYYKGDDVLLDDHDVPLYDAKNIVGPTEELEFGKGSEDPSLVYIRNERLEAEYEVILETGYYQVEVLGEELEHSFDRKEPLHKFRD